MFAKLKLRYAQSAMPSVLPGYRKPKHPWLLNLRNRSALSLLVLIGLFYGFACAIFPIYLFVFLVIPLFFLLALVLWALPEMRSVPERVIEGLYFAFVIGLFLWPNYLAIALPGVPWITINRLISVPLMLTFLVSLSMSSSMRRELNDSLRSNKWIIWLLLVFVSAQSYTLLFDDLREGLNKYIDQQAQWTGIFFVSAWLFRKPGKAEKFMKYMMFCGVVMILLALIEWQLGHVAWRDITPSFLRPDGDAVDRIYVGQRRAGVGTYRVQGTFSTSLNLAEFFAFTFCIGYYWLMAARRAVSKLLILLYFAVAFWIVMLTDLRDGPVCIFAATFVWAFFWTLRRWRWIRDDLLAPFVVTIFPIIFCGFIALSLTWNRLKVMTWGGGQHQASTDTRILQWTNFWPALAKWPIGYGVTRGSEQAGTVNGDGVFTLDSYIILIFLDYGIIGGLAYFGTFLVASATAIRGGVSGVGRDENLLLGGGVLFIVFLVSKVVLAQDDIHSLIFMAVGMICALSAGRHKGTAALELNSVDKVEASGHSPVIAQHL